MSVLSVISFNIGTISNEDGMYLCELNYETKDVVKHALKKSIGYDYHDITYSGKVNLEKKRGKPKDGGRPILFVLLPFDRYMI